jgi:hypothetical protein
MATTDQQGSEQDAPGVNTTTTTEQDGTPEQPEPMGDSKGTGNKEAAKYRRQLRDTETERDALAGTVAGLQRQLVASSLPPGTKLTMDALALSGLKPADFFNVDGVLDEQKLGAEVRGVHEKLGVPMPRPGFVPDSGTGRGGGESGRVTLAGEARKRQG